MVKIAVSNFNNWQPRDKSQSYWPIWSKATFVHPKRVQITFKNTLIFIIELLLSWLSSSASSSRLWIGVALVRIHWATDLVIREASNDHHLPCSHPYFISIISKKISIKSYKRWSEGYSMITIRHTIKAICMYHIIFFLQKMLYHMLQKSNRNPRILTHSSQRWS